MNLLLLIKTFLSLGVIVNALPNTIANGQTEDANPVQANMQWIVDQVNANVPPLIPSLGAITNFTPVLTFGGASVGLTYFSQNGQYVALGPLVFFNFQISVNAVGASAGIAEVGGLPATINAAMASSFYGGFLITRNVRITGGAGGTLPVWCLNPGTTTLGLKTMQNINTAVTLTNLDFPGAISGQGFYFR